MRLLSRARVYVLKSLSAEDLSKLLDRAVSDPERGLGALNLQIDAGARELLLAAADGDARRMLNLLETAADLSTPGDSGRRLDTDTMRAVIGSTYVRFDKGGENFYDQISALHKSVRGSDPDAALYWLCRMLAGGCDPLYIARRALRMASEDIGNADPRALTMALEACAVYERLGSPEGELAIAQAIVFMACAAKSNAVYTAFNAARRRCRQARLARGPAAPAQRAHAPDEGHRLRQGLSLRARRAGRLCGGRALFSGRNAGSPLLCAGAARTGDQNRRGARGAARDAMMRRLQDGAGLNARAAN